MRNQDCIKTEELESLADKTIAVERRQLIESHLAGCAACRGAAAALYREIRMNTESFAAPEGLKLKAASMVGNEMKPEEPGQSSLGSKPAFRWFRPIMVFASLLLVVAFGMGTYTFVRMQRETEPDVFRDANNGRQLIEVTLPVGKSFSEGSEIYFEWKAVEGAKKYKLIVSEAGGDIIEEIETEDTKFQKALKSHGIEKYLYFQIKTMLADGTEIESETRKIVFK